MTPRDFFLTLNLHFLVDIQYYLQVYNMVIRDICDLQSDLSNTSTHLTAYLALTIYWLSIHKAALDSPMTAFL